jgi:hypothetical protein
MKTIRHIALVSLITVGIAAAGLPALGQTNSPPAPVVTVISNQMGQVTVPVDEGSFISTVLGYFTSFNTNLAGTFTNKGMAWAGASSIVGGPSGEPSLVNELGASYAVFNAFDAELVLRNANVAGTVDSLQGGVAYGLVMVDTRLAPYLDGGYDWNLKKMYAECGLRVQKALTTHTFAQVSYGVQVLGTKGSPPQVLGAAVGFTF